MKFGEQSRREFCGHACRALSAAVAGGALLSTLEACGSGGPASPSSFSALPVVNGTFANNALVATIDAASPLASVGGAALVQAPGALALVTRTAQTTFVALTATCTHQACTITGFGNGAYVCPCHGSQFDTNGNVLSGPAFVPLTHLQAQFADPVLTITG